MFDIDEVSAFVAQQLCLIASEGDADPDTRLRALELLGMMCGLLGQEQVE